MINGYAIGIDKLADECCLGFNIPTERILPDYKNNYPKAAPLIRDKEMVHLSNKLLSFFDGIEAGGSWFTLKYARKYIDVHIVDIREDWK